MHNGNWDDLRFVLMVAESGSVSAAARALGVNHATVLRRIAAFEETRGVRVFEKGPRGYAVRPDSLPIVEAARDAADAVARVGELARGQRPWERPVRITATDSFSIHILPPIVSRLAADPELPPIEVHCTNARRDLGRLHADITVRPAHKLPPDLSGEVAGHLGFGVYGGAGGAGRGFLGLSGEMATSPTAEWLRNQTDDRQFRLSADSFLVLAEWAALGMGLAWLPCFVGEAHEGLEAVPGQPPQAPVPIWVASHIELAEVPRLKMLRARICTELRAMSGVLAAG